MARYTGAVCRQCRREGQKQRLDGVADGEHPSQLAGVGEVHRDVVVLVVQVKSSFWVLSRSLSL